MTKYCKRCGKQYEYLKKVQYKNKSPKLCLSCKELVSSSSINNIGTRPIGHKTRQQHKRIR